MEQVVKGHPIVGELRGVGLLAGFQLVKDQAKRTVFAPEQEVGIRAREFATQNNLIMRPLGHVDGRAEPAADHLSQRDR